MFSADQQLLYIGKAKNLKNRLSSYFKTTVSAPKTAALVAKIASIELTVTANETEALLLEQTLIKQWRPPYNILLRDDKSYPYVIVSSNEFPRLGMHRGSKKKQAAILALTPALGRLKKVSACCKKPLKCASAKIAFTTTAAALACNTKFNAAKHPA